MSAFKWTVATIAALLVVIVLLTVLGRWRWGKLSDGLFAQLQATRTQPQSQSQSQSQSQPSRFDTRELVGLPAPVRRYFRAVLTDGQPLVAAVNVQHQGSFNLGEDVDRWRPFTSSQQVVTQRPGFVWNGRIKVLPGLDVWVHDAYVAGSGILHPAVAGLISLTDLRGTGEVAQGELLRYFAEAAWYPTALLPSQGVRWEAVDEQSARATLTDGALSVTLTFTFSPEGLMQSCLAQARSRVVGGQTISTPWQGRWSDTQWQGGMRVPMSGEVAWLLASGPKTYWRGSITSLRYEFVP